MKYIEESEAEELYSDMLDEAYGSVKIAGIEFSPSMILKELDPIAYSCGLSDWLDSEDLTTSLKEAEITNGDGE